MKKLSDIEEKIYNNGERLIPGVTHDIQELIRHRSSYLFFKEIIERDLATANTTDTVEIVDLGCGVGYGCHLLSKIGNVRITGIDVSGDVLAYAKAHYNAPNITYAIGNLTDFIPSMPEFDYVVSRGVLEHVPGGLDLVAKVKWKIRLMFDVPYNEAQGNSHHVLLGIREREFERFPSPELFFEDINGVITCDHFDDQNAPNMVSCVCSRPDLPKISNTIVFPISADREDGEGWPSSDSNVRWVDRDELFPTITHRLVNSLSLLDVGCGILPRKEFASNSLVYIGCEPHTTYLNHFIENTKKLTDTVYAAVHADWRTIITKAPDKSVDAVLLVDVIEHLDKQDSLDLLKQTERIVKKQIIVFTPLGYLEQHRDACGRDAWGLDGGSWQDHKSGWTPNDFDETWEILASENFHASDNLGHHLDIPAGAFFAIKNFCQRIPTSKQQPSDKEFDGISLAMEKLDVVWTSFSRSALRRAATLSDQCVELKRGLEVVTGQYEEASTRLQSVTGQHEEASHRLEMVAGQYEEARQRLSALQQSQLIILRDRIAHHPVLLKISKILFFYASMVQ